MVTPVPNELSPAERRRGLIVLMVATFLTWGGFFVVVPLVAVHYVDGLGWAASSIGLILAVRQFTQQGTTTLSGALADRLGAKGLICAGMAIRALGFLIMAKAETFPILLLSVIVAGFGGGLFESPKAAAIATLTDPSNRRRFYSMSGVVAGIGVAIGTQTGALLIRTDFALVSLCGAIVFALTFVICLMMLPPVRVATESHGIRKGFARVGRDRLFVTYAATLMGYYFISTQFSLTLSLTAASVSGTDSAVSWVWGINSAVTMLLGYPLPRLLERRIAAFPTMIGGIALSAIGMGLVGLATNVPVLLGCVVVISLGTVLFRPGEQTVTAGLAAPAARGSYFGVAALSLAIGGGLGQYTGGIIYDYGERANHSALPWMVFCAVGLVTVAGLWRLRSPVERRGQAVERVEDESPHPQPSGPPTPPREKGAVAESEAAPVSAPGSPSPKLGRGDD